MLKSACTLTAILLAIASRSLAQLSNVTRCLPGYQWSINSRGQTPCLVGAYLESICSGFGHDVNEIPPGHHYLGPTFAQADPCSCNSVTYSVISACGGCQGRTFVPYDEWTTNCTFVVNVGQYPRSIPNIIEVPSWAYLNISLTGGTFSPIEAEAVTMRGGALPPGSSPPALSTSSEPTPQTSLPSPSSTLATTPAPSRQGSGGTSAGVIAGSVVGALIGIIAVLLLSCWFLLRAKRRRNPKPTPLDDPLSPIDDKPPALPISSFGHTHTKSLSDPASIITPYMYSNSEVSGRPLSPETSLYTTAHRRNSLDGINSLQTLVSPQSLHNTAHRGYTGAAEV